ncbi:hypothetical protein ID866_9531 [Astraeus odoratus]|nr:hypothetical protein ID866_9531 [Astraeus odoratus]
MVVEGWMEVALDGCTLGRHTGISCDDRYSCFLYFQLGSLTVLAIQIPLNHNNPYIVPCNMSQLAPNAAIHRLSCARMSGDKRPSAERRPERVACATSNTLPGGSRTGSGTILCRLTSIPTTRPDFMISHRENTVAKKRVRQTADA